MSKYEDKRKHLIDLTDDELEAYFFKLTEEIVEPMLSLAKKYTTPSIERSILLRMGFSSLEAQAIVSQALKKELLGHGAGNLVLKYAQKANLDYYQAGLKLSNGEGWEELQTITITSKEGKEDA